MGVEVTLVLPVYNEASRIKNTVEIAASELHKITNSFEIIIAEDGSTDGTDRIAGDLAGQFDYVKHLHSPQRLGRGRALNNAFNASSGEIFVYFDADMATDIAHLKELIQAIRDGNDIASGSRLMRESDVERPFSRDIASKGYNLLVRGLLGSELRDHQCGFKAFRRGCFEKLAGEVKDMHWFWDTEFLVRAQRAGYRVKEFPVKWRHGGATKVKFGRDILGMGSKILALWWEFNRTKLFSRRHRLLIALIIALLILYYIVIYLEVSKEKLIQALADADYRLILLAFAAYLVSWPVRGFRYQHILNRTGYREGLDLNFLTGLIFISQSANVVTPARIGDLTRAYLLKARKGIALTTCFSSLTVERIFDVIAITVYAGAAFVFLIGQIAIRQEIIYALALGALLILLFFVFLLLFRRERFVFPSDSKLKAALVKFFTEIRDVSAQPLSFILLLLVSLAIWAIDVLACYIILACFKVAPALPLVFLAVTIGNLVKVVPVTPGGIGTYEGALTVVFALGGIQSSLALVVAILDHFVKNAATLIFGFIYLMKFELSFKDLTGKME